MPILTAEEAKLLDPADAGEATFTFKFNPKGPIEVVIDSSIEFPSGTTARQYVAVDNLAVAIIGTLDDIQVACIQQMGDSDA